MFFRYSLGSIVDNLKALSLTIDYVALHSSTRGRPLSTRDTGTYKKSRQKYSSHNHSQGHGRLVSLK